MRAKKIISLSFLFILFSSFGSTSILFGADVHDEATENFYRTTVRQGISYREATPADLEELLAITAAIEEDDRDNLLILPNNRSVNFQALSFQSSLEKGRIFVAYDRNQPAGNNIISFIKLFLVQTLEDKLEILQHELRAIESAKYGHPQLEALTLYSGIFNSNRAYNQIYQFGQALNERVMRASSGNNPFPTEKHIEKTCCIYVGSQYTVPHKAGYGLLADSVINYRGLGISTKLEKRALQLRFQNIIHEIQTTNATRLAMLYGLVEKNKNTLCHIRDFMATAQYVKAGLRKNFNVNSQISIACFKYTAFKPAFWIQGRKLKQYVDSNKKTLAGKGYGCILMSEL
jgi:hypothetical protein